MNHCGPIERLLPRFVGGELRPKDFDKVSGHLKECGACASEAESYSLAIEAARGAWGEPSRMPAVVVTRIADRAAGEALVAPWWRRPVFVGPQVSLAAGLSMATLCLVLALPMMRNQAPESAAGPVRLDMQVEGGMVRVAWSDGKGRPYKVYKATDPRLLGQGKAALVAGSQWVDMHPDSSQVVFYRVE
jgi:anti-sigma factor RsiW